MVRGGSPVRRRPSSLFVAASKTLQDWGADVGLGKNLYKVGVATDGTPDDAVAGLGGHTDWKVLKTAEVEFAEDDALTRLARKEKLVDPTYYPKLRGAQGIVKVNLVAVENSRVIALALNRLTTMDTTNSTRKMKNSTWAMSPAALATPPKPNTAATMAMIRKTAAQYSIAASVG
jgi:hypothetical protein